uniref:Putative tick transposon n=1 Tax=Rhipicephalus microplus TaxID=6941 RepID=A0A6G5AC18_RHIMP
MLFISSKSCHKAHLVYQQISHDYEVLVQEIHFPGCAPLSIVNNYFPAGLQDQRALDVAVSFCRNSILFAGDLNSHHVPWGFRTDLSGKRLWDWTNRNNLICWNSRVPTFVRCNSRSVLDLTFASSSVTISSWTVLDTATSIDHCPLVFEVSIPFT